MADPLRGKYHEVFKEEYDKAIERLAPLGGEVTPGVHDYEAFYYAAPGLKLIFYPHKTSAKNYHIRVRAAIKTDRKKLRAAIFALAENSCTFQFPSEAELHQEAVTASILNSRP